MITPLFSAPDSFARRGLEQLFLVLDRVMPMNGSQKRDLAMACRDLSALLTTERDGLSRRKKSPLQSFRCRNAQG